MPNSWASDKDTLTEGTRLAQSVRHLMADFGSGEDLRVLKWMLLSLPLSLSPSFCPSSYTLSLTNK